MNCLISRLPIWCNNLGERTRSILVKVLNCELFLEDRLVLDSLRNCTCDDLSDVGDAMSVDAGEYVAGHQSIVVGLWGEAVCVGEVLGSGRAGGGWIRR